METLLSAIRDSRREPNLWREPRAWLREKGFSRGYWIFFAAAFFFDAGFAIYVFIYSLFLFGNHLNEQAIGWIGGAMTAGSMVGTLPAGALARRYGLRSVLLVLFLAAPAIGIVRVLWLWIPAQIVLAFLEGLVMSGWGVCFLPAVARLTTEANRTSAFSLIFCVSVGTSILGGIVCGYLGHWLRLAGIMLPEIEIKSIILIASCLLVFAGLIPVLNLKIPAEQRAEENLGLRGAWLDVWKPSPFLIRFLPSMAFWCSILAAFALFANIYLSRQLHVPMEQIGLLFSTVQIVQLCMGAVAPLLFRLLGLIRGIVTTQIAAAILLALLAEAKDATAAIVLYLVFSAAQWMSSPGLYNLLMNETPDQDRSAAAAMTLFCNSLAGSAAAALAGVLVTRFGYPPVLLGMAVAAFCSALSFWLLLESPKRRHRSERSA